MKSLMMTIAGIITIKSHIKTGVLGFGFLFLFNCEANSNLTAKEIVEKSCEVHGGIDKWGSIKSLSFDKSTRLYLEDGTVESDLNQNQVITFKPRYTIKIRSLDDSKISMVYDEGYIRKRVDGQLVTDSLELLRARNSLMAAEYVIKQPFALLDEGVELQLLGVKKIKDREYYEIRVSYPDEKPDSDKWFYYFDKEDLTFSFNKVELSDHTSWVENQSFDESTDFKFYSRRKSYRLNAEGEKTFLRAEYYYRNFKVIY